MGTDIHGWIEIRHSPADPWRFAGGIVTERNYGLFALLANVRGETPCPHLTRERRGVPRDLSEVGRELVAAERLGDHSTTWLYAEELEAIERWTHGVDGEWGRAFSTFYWHVRSCAWLFLEDIDLGTVRVVLGFDS